MNSKFHLTVKLNLTNFSIYQAVKLNSMNSQFHETMKINLMYSEVNSENNLRKKSRR